MNNDLLGDLDQLRQEYWLIQERIDLALDGDLPLPDLEQEKVNILEKMIDLSQIFTAKLQVLKNEGG